MALPDQKFASQTCVVEKPARFLAVATRQLNTKITSLVVALLFSLAWSVKANPVDIWSFGTGSLKADPTATTATFEQDANGLIFPATFALGHTVGAEFTSVADWTRFADTELGICMSYSGGSLSSQPFTVELIGPDFQVINAYQGNTHGVSASPTFVPLHASRSGTGDFSKVIGVQFTWDGAAEFTAGNLIKVHGVAGLVTRSGNIGTGSSAPIVAEPTLVTGTKKQRITFNTTKKPVVGKTYRLRGRASSRLRLDYAVSDPAVAEIVSLPQGARGLRILSAGSASVTASQGGDSLWAPAAPVTRSFTAWPAKKRKR
jgi:hypothetical protein